MKRLIKILAWLIGIVIVLIVVAIVGFKLFFQDDAKALAVEKGSAALGRPLAIENINLSFWGGIGIDLGGVTIGNPEGFPEGDFMKAENVDVKLKIFPLLKGEYQLSRLIIDKPSINLLKRADGSNNFTFTAVDSALSDTTVPEKIREMAPEKKSAAAAVSFDRLEINNGELVYKDDSSHTTVRMANFDLSTSLQNPKPGIFQSSGRMKTDRLEVAMPEPYPVFAVAAAYNATYDFGSDQLTVERADISVNDLKMALSGKVDGLTGNTMSADLLVKSDEIAIGDVLSLLPAGQLEMLQDYKVDGSFSLNADISYDGAEKKNPVTYTGTATLSDIRMSKKDIEGELQLGRAMIDFKPDNMRLTIQEGMFDGKPLKGYLTVDNFADPSVNGELSGSLNLAFVAPFLPAEQKTEMSGAASFNVKFAGRVKEAEKMDFSGGLTVSDGEYNSTFLPEPINSFSLDIYFDNRLINVRQFTSTFPSGSADFKGRVVDLVPYLMADSVHAAKIVPTIDGDLKGRLDLAMLKQFLPEKGNPEMSGQFSMNLNLSGKLLEPTTIQPRGDISVVNGAYSDTLLPEPVKSLTLQMSLVPDTIKIKDLTVKFVSSDASFSGKMVRSFPYLLPFESIDRSNVKRPLFLFTLSSHRFDTDKLFPEAVPGSGARPPDSKAALDSVSVILLPDVDGQGTISIDTLIYSQVDFTNLKGSVKIQDRKITVYQVTADVYTGTATGETTIDLGDFENPHYTGQFAANQIEANDFVSRFTKFGGYLYGKINVNGTYNAHGWDPDAFMNSLTLDGKGNMQQGKLITSGAVYSMLNSLAKQTNQTFDKEQALKNLNTNIVVKDGKVFVDNLKTRLGSIGDVTIGGYYGFNEQIGYTGSILLSESLTQKLVSQGGILGGVANLFSSDKNQRVDLPLKIGGTIDKPSVEIDWQAMQDTAGEKMKDKAGDLLKGLFKKK